MASCTASCTTSAKPEENRSAASSVTASPETSYHPASWINFTHVDALPPASRLRALTVEVNKFVGNACHLFIHHVDPLLERRRKELLDSGKTRKKYYWDARKLWAMGDRFFWQHQVAQLRLNLKQGHLSAEQILRDAGAKDEWLEYLRQAEKDVAAYLGTELPDWVCAEGVMVTSGHGTTGLPEASLAAMLGSASPNMEALKALIEEGNFQMLDTLADEFPVERRQVYGNFAQLWPYETVRQAEGKHQKAILRQLADLIDRSGKELFYYFVYPRLCKMIQPCPANLNIASIAQEIWKLMEGERKKQWELASVRTKRLLGDGNIEGLEKIQLDGIDEDVLRLHEMTECAVKGWKDKIGTVSEM